MLTTLFSPVTIPFKKGTTQPNETMFKIHSALTVYASVYRFPFMKSKSFLIIKGTPLLCCCHRASGKWRFLFTASSMKCMLQDVCVLMIIRHHTNPSTSVKLNKQQRHVCAIVCVLNCWRTISQTSQSAKNSSRNFVESRH